MKSLKKIVIGIMVLFASNSMTSQVSINVNVGSQPSWGPSGYNAVNYYYLPDIQTYYDVPAAQFIYLNQGKWVRNKHLPRQYSNYNLYNGHKVVINNYKGSRPYHNFKYDKKKYYVGYKGSPQHSMGKRYVDNKNHMKGSHGKQGHKKGKH